MNLSSLHATYVDEFPCYVLTFPQFIRTVTEVRPEWLLEFAPSYYDPRTLDGEIKRVF